MFSGLRSVDDAVRVRVVERVRDGHHHAHNFVYRSTAFSRSSRARDSPSTKGMT
jgi:hypothetical protein